MKYAVYTLGCKVNQYETQALETMLRARGLEPTETGERADVVIVNTCAVTAESGRKSRQAIRRLMAQHPGALTAVCGCFSQLEPEQVKELGADIVFGSGEKEKLADAIADALPAVEIDDPFRRKYFEPLPAGAAAGRTRAMLKIQDGCDHFCTYCVIPYTRGRVRSLPLADCAAQATDLKERGFREIVLTGIEIASYGKDLPEKPGLADAVETVAQAAPDVRLHLGSLEPTVITEDFCARLAALGQLCRHFHLSLQSGCDNTLKRMARRYDTAAFLAACDRLRRYFPGCSLTADLICGFPGETEADFSATLDFLEQCEFFYVHAFPYSPRPGTKAAAMPGQLSHAQKETRVLRAREVIDRLQQRYLQAQVGNTLSVLFENEWEGHGDNYCRVRADRPVERGSVLPVRITDVSGDKLLGCINDLQSMTSVL
ncbi:MAG: tRNA (N(6)-L-threonylcarbamoyladenosine(37)-C(2))-methylthiotransferase MtaB [Oscillospiraceae bacterium]|nr:tRNA (N(6)-L-threonylcarbamoyladenosine(37)-C(2))-methylthiotransferase MtaB [Oscillospiraceae bacterium]